MTGHFWVRDSLGNISTFRVPGQIVVPGNDHGSDAKAINALGVITGFWFDTNYALHGYIALPCHDKCFEDDHAATAETGVTPPTTSNQVTLDLPGIPNSKLRLTPYRNFGAQPGK